MSRKFEKRASGSGRTGFLDQLDFETMDTDGLLPRVEKAQEKGVTNLDPEDVAPRANRLIEGRVKDKDDVMIRKD